jgi:hypothetical protein
MKLPNYQCFVHFLYENKLIDWNPREHEDWELPPPKCLEWYWNIFPLDEVKVEDIVNYISDEAKKSIYEYFLK